MDRVEEYTEFLRKRITELRLHKNISEHKMSLELGKSGAYIRSITNGTSLPSTRELMNIIVYFNMTPSEFFSGAEGKSLRTNLIDALQCLDDADLEKVALFIGWISK